MNLNVFTWIREGVRQSVLAGVTDALDDMGTPPDGDDLKERVRQSLVRRMDELGTPKVGDTARPKRLGRSLKDLEFPDK